MSSVKLGETLRYGGREGANPSDPLDQRMTISFHLNDRKINLTATDDVDEEPIRHARDAIYFGGGGLILLGCTESAGVPTLEFAIDRCKHCSKPIVSMFECEWKTCDACADKCGHEYERGMVHGGKAGAMGVGEFCGKCGRGKPEQKVHVGRGRLNGSSKFRTNWASSFNTKTPLWESARENWLKSSD
jgi:hypothetical protein